MMITSKSKIEMVDRHLDPNDFEEIRKVSLKEYNYIQADHIMKHKWYLSQELNREVSFNEACKDWINSKLAVEFRKYFIITK